MPTMATPRKKTICSALQLRKRPNRHYDARLYDPAVGRFLSPDPYVQNSDFSQSYNRYSYAWNNPLRYTDPTGEKETYTWDPDLKEYRDEKGQLADWSEVYKAVFESGCLSKELHLITQRDTEKTQRIFLLCVSLCNNFAISSFLYTFVLERMI